MYGEGCKVFHASYNLRFRYFESKSNIDQAIPMYTRAGCIEKALQLSFENGNLNALGDIALELGTSISPDLLQKCMRHYVDVEEYGKLVDLLVRVEKYEEAIRVCAQQNVVINDIMIETIGTKNESIAKLLAETLVKQKSYIQASKLFVALGDRLNALKSLMCQGDYEQVIFFASKLKAIV